jgi:hypothetical protein
MNCVCLIGSLGKVEVSVVGDGKVVGKALLAVPRMRAGDRIGKQVYSGDARAKKDMNTYFRSYRVRRRWVRWGLTAAVIGIVCAGTLTLLATRVAASQDELQIRQVAQDALIANQTVTLPVPNRRGQLIATAAGTSMKISAHRRLEAVYTGSLLTEREAELDTAIDGQTKGNIRVLGGGLDWINVKTVNISGNSATAKGPGADMVPRRSGAIGR